MTVRCPLRIVLGGLLLAATAFAADCDVQAAVERLAAGGFLQDAPYWQEHAHGDQACAGSQVAGLLIQLAEGLGGKSKNLTVDQALAVLAGQGIIINDYWQQNAVPGKGCRGQYVGNLLCAAASRIDTLALMQKYGAPGGLISQPEPSAFTLGNRGGVDNFNRIVGTQTFGATYQFTDKPLLLETAEAIRGLGATVIKFEISARYGRPDGGNIPAPVAGIDSLTKLVRDEPVHRQVMDMPFAHVVLWAHTFADGQGRWRDGFSQAEAEADYRELYELTCYLLKTYSGTHRTFYLGHWEGDGWLRGSIDRENDAKVTPVATQGMIDWLNNRQRAIDDARRDTPHPDVAVWHYAEVNHVTLAMQGRPAMVNKVLPHAAVDLVSYSCYDTQADPELLKAALNYIEQQLQPKPGITGRRVFIGEYGFPSVYHSPAQQAENSRKLMQAAIEWGCPMVLYWELYNNELDADGKQRGFWLIDDHNRKQPAWHLLHDVLANGEAFLRSQPAGTVPSNDTYRTAALQWLEVPPRQ